jgi:hypothetical protein
MKNVIKYSAVVIVILVTLIFISAKSRDSQPNSEIEQISETTTYKGVSMEDKGSW